MFVAESMPFFLIALFALSRVFEPTFVAQNFMVSVDMQTH